MAIHPVIYFALSILCAEAADRVSSRLVRIPLLVMALLVGGKGLLLLWRGM